MWGSATSTCRALTKLVVSKCAVGSAGNRDALDLPDDELLTRVRADLAAAVGVRAAPLETRIVRFPQALPACIRDGAAVAERIAASLDPSTQITTQAA
jgi:protoporphyrinogen oxidase